MSKKQNQKFEWDRISRKDKKQLNNHVKIVNVSREKDNKSNIEKFGCSAPSASNIPKTQPTKGRHTKYQFGTIALELVTDEKRAWLDSFYPVCTPPPKGCSMQL